ncbi:DUF6281 family protein [Streptomyces sp. ActVer]|uniref:DUF6281 family protein n=1 Tax=Streptomyces sp. ActVer TaxID=3014558 RepID=UPI0022B3A977|nr:DUF6281 family protein [Streptomyces sp. ActVer]MCZ4513914.1 DUF6281 family protein [Streptomyces sp. ActVer]
MNHIRHLRATTVMACLLLSAAACAEPDDERSDSEDHGRGTGSCASQLTYEGRSYKAVANLEFTATDGLGEATQPPCNDTGKEPTSEDLRKETAYRVAGISPTVAIAVGETTNTAKLFAVYSGSNLPKEVRELHEPP